MDGDGAGLRVLQYFKPADPSTPWKYEVVCDFMHISHNFPTVNWDDDPEEELIIAGKEGVWYLDSQENEWSARQLTDWNPPCPTLFLYLDLCLYLLQAITLNDQDVDSPYP